MIDMNKENLIPFKEALKLLPKNNDKPAHLALLYRWASEGLHGVYLEFVQAGGTRCTTKEAIHRFFKKLTENEMESSTK